MVSMHVLVDGSSLWQQRLQHIDITRLSYNAVQPHGTRLPRYKEGRLYQKTLLTVNNCDIRFSQLFGHIDLRTVTTKCGWGAYI